MKVSQISNLAKDLARALSAISVRVVDVIPGKSCVGLEIPNEKREIVALSEIIKSQDYEEAGSPLTLALGKDIPGNRPSWIWGACRICWSPAPPARANPWPSTP